MRGGKRSGAGRKKGSPNKASAIRERKVAASGITPLDVMIRAMRVLSALADECVNDKKGNMCILFARQRPSQKTALASFIPGWRPSSKRQAIHP